MSDLLSASKSGQLAEVERLLRQGADVHSADEYGWTALH